MNTFSNSLFTFLFGWARSLIEGVWNAAAEGKFSRFFAWLGDHWLGMALFLVLACTAVDFLIWMIRWRPYLVWRSQLRRLGRRLRGEKVDDRRRFAQGYQEGVALDLGNEEEASPQPPEQPQDTGVAYRLMLEEFAPAERQPVFFHGREEEAPEREEEFIPEGRRRRRSEKHESGKKPAWRQRLTAQEDQDEGMLDGLPPAVDREQAFHEPVYPVHSYRDWSQPMSGGGNEKKG